MKDKFRKEVECLYQDNFAGEYICDMIYRMGECLFDVEDFCDELVNVDEASCTREYRNKRASAIKRLSREMFRYMDMYFFLKNSLNKDAILEETLEINDFIKEVAENCGKYTGLNFPVQKKAIEPTFIKVNKNYTIFVILMQVRNALIKNAKTVKFGYCVEDEKLKLSLKFRSSKSENLLAKLDEDVTQRFLAETSDLISSRIYSEV